MSFRMPTHRAPTHPGVILQKEFLEPLGITQKQLAESIGMPAQGINDIVNGRRGITARTALRFAKFFETTPELWMNLQLCLELWESQREEADEIKTIKTWRALEHQAAAD